MKDCIEDKWDWSKTHPVIHLSFDAITMREIGLDVAIKLRLKELAEEFVITLVNEHYALQFQELVVALRKKVGEVVILVDEYDKPIIQYLEYDQLAKARENQAIMKDFYSVLKNSGQDLRFLFVTGVSKFSKVSIFSDLNHLGDITMHKDYSTLTGYTQEELEDSFGDYLEDVQNNLQIDRSRLIETMKWWYNGFSWDGVTKVYNPFGVLRFLSNQRFDNYWFSTGTPTFLLSQMKKHELYDVENVAADSTVLDNSDIENIDLIALLFQTGYLTVKRLDLMTGEMVLDYPNKEVRESLYRFLLNDLARTNPVNSAGNSARHLSTAFAHGNLDKVRKIINSLLAGAPYETYQHSSEGLYHGLIYFIFKLLGISTQCEVHSSEGRADSIVETKDHVYIFEFKFNKTAEEAVAQIKKNGYARPYQALEKKVVGIGVNFELAAKSITGWMVEELSL